MCLLTFSGSYNPIFMVERVLLGIVPFFWPTDTNCQAQITVLITSFFVAYFLAVILNTGWKKTGRNDLKILNHFHVYLFFR